MSDEATGEMGNERESTDGIVTGNEVGTEVGAEGGSSAEIQSAPGSGISGTGREAGDTGVTDEGEAAAGAPAGEVEEDSQRSAREQEQVAQEREQEARAVTLAAEQESVRRTRRSFLVASAGAAGGFAIYRWLDHAPSVGRLAQPLRKTVDFNARVSRAVFDERGLAPEYPLHRASELRVNAGFGLERELIPESWRLQMVGVEGAERHPRFVTDVTSWEYRYTAAAAKAEEAGPKTSPEELKALAEKQKTSKPHRGQDEAGESASELKPGTPGLLLTMADVKMLGHRELVTQFKCIEGWSQIVHWGGVRLVDLMRAYPPARMANGALPRFVYMETPDGNFYCGYDRMACEHPQSLLVTEMMGRPIEPGHGAPLRLHMPIKYGYKQIKRIGLIAYTDVKPDDYWTKLGYDWYAGL